MALTAQVELAKTVPAPVTTPVSDLRVNAHRHVRVDADAFASARCCS